MLKQTQNAVAVAAKVEVVLTADGQVQARAVCPSREVMRLMLQKALADLEWDAFAKEEALKVQPAAPGLVKGMG